MFQLGNSEILTRCLLAFDFPENFVWELRSLQPISYLTPRLRPNFMRATHFPL